MNRLFRSRNDNAKPEEIVVPNAGQMMLLWEVARVLQLCVPLSKARDHVRARYGTENRELAMSLADSDAREYYREHMAEWDRHRAPARDYVAAYRGEYDQDFPRDLDDVRTYLDAVELDVSAIGQGGSGRQNLIMTVAAYAGLRKAEIAIAAAHASILPLGQPARRELQDLAAQMSLIERDAIRRRNVLADEVRAGMIKKGLAGNSAKIRMPVVCTTRHEVPCCIWRPVILA